MELERVVAISVFVNIEIALVNFQTAKLNSKRARDEKEKRHHFKEVASETKF